MSKVHSKNMVIMLSGANMPVTGVSDISQHVNSSEFNQIGDSHDVTTYGKDDHVREGGLGDGTFSMGGWYDSAAGTGPRALLKDLKGKKVTLTRQPEGTGSGKPQDVVDIVVTSYVESAPVADYIQWSLEAEFSDAVNDTAQS